MQRKGLGARYVRDPRADAYLMAPRLQAAPSPPPEKEWELGPTLDQGREGSCVGHGWAHWRNAAPVQPSTPFDHAYAVEAYNYAQSVDEWSDTPPEEGTSVQAGAKAMVKDGALTDGYLWGKTYDDLISWLGNYGPVVAGTLWLRSMRTPDANGFLTCDGTIDGGHCYLIYGYTGGGEIIKCQNSWGNDWGDKGRFYIQKNEFMKLMARGQYSLCSAAELAPPPPEPKEPALPRKSLTKFVASGVKERTGITRNGKKFAIAEPWKE